MAPPELCDNELWEDRTRFLCNRQAVHIVIKMDFECHYKADGFGKVEQTKEMVLTAVKPIKFEIKLRECRTAKR